MMNMIIVIENLLSDCDQLTHQQIQSDYLYMDSSVSSGFTLTYSVYGSVAVIFVCIYSTYIGYVNMCNTLYSLLNTICPDCPS